VPDTRDTVVHNATEQTEGAHMRRATSADGTVIAYDRIGTGPPLVLVGGGLADRSEHAPLASALAESFTVVNYDRRGRGDSGDTPPYGVGREIEDIESLIAAVGGRAHLFGASSGGALALEAAAAGAGIDRLAVYDVPYSVSADAIDAWRAYRHQLAVLLQDHRHDEALRLFMRLAGSSPADIAAAERAPIWPALVSVAPTLAYDAACLGDGPPPAGRLAGIAAPTLVATGGGADPHTAGLARGFFDDAADAVAVALPRAERRVVDSDTHVADPRALGPTLTEFLSRPGT
jgi:pimeloyl-ACP methyl ester carboxylesterase